MLSALLLLLSAARAFQQPAHQHDAVHFVLVNEAQGPVFLWWIHPQTGELVLQTSSAIRHSQTQKINSYASHAFAVTKVYDQSYDEQTSFVVPSVDVQIYVRQDPDTKRIRVHVQNPAVRLWNLVLEAVGSCAERSPGLIGLQQPSLLEECPDAIPLINSPFLEIKELSRIRERQTLLLRNYTCADNELETTLPIHSTFWNGLPYNMVFKAHGVEIGVVENFVSDQECEALISRAEPLLSRASVIGEGGKSVISNARKASAAMVSPDRKDPNDVLVGLQDRAIAFVNTRTGYNLSWPGQEGFSTIKYLPGDEYTPHCDGACDGTPQRKGGRVATMVLYCNEPGEGGATTFTNADVYVRPKKGFASFFSYMDEQGLMDPLMLSQHSGCPVTQGEKWIATQWLRRGVDKDNPWFHFEPSGTEQVPS